MTISVRRCPPKPWQRTQKGQVLLIFALTAVVLFAIMGLAVDAGISYFHSDEQQKAAESAALSGVSYLPGNTTDAAAEALDVAQRDGYPNSDVTTVTPYDGNTNELEVSITALAPVYFLELLGFGQHEVTASAVAQYLPPIQLGAAASNQLGGTIQSLENNTGTYLLRTIGWGDPRSEGDPFTPSPDDDTNSCGPNKDGSCLGTTHPDVHAISCIEGDDLCDGSSGSKTSCGTAGNICLNDTGGENYLIYVPADTTANIGVYNPSFDPGDDTNCGSQTASCLDTFHEDDGSFPTLTSDNPSATTVPSYDYDSMGYTIFAVPDLNNRSNDIPLLQDIFCPFNAYDLDTGAADQYTYYEEGTSGAACNPVDATTRNTATLETVTGTPTVYNAPPAGVAADGKSYTPKPTSDPNPNDYIPLTAPGLTGANATLFDQTYNVLSTESAYTYEVGGNYYLYGGAGGQYFRLRVDTLAWNGAAINTSDATDSPEVDSANIPNDYPVGHNAYALDVTTPASGLGNCASTTTGVTCTISAMTDMTFYTPINGSVASNFTVPLFSLPTAYAGKVITVSAFDPGDVGGGTAYLGILQPAYTATSTTGTTNYPLEYATVTTNTAGGADINDVGTTLGSGTSSAIAPNDGTNPLGYTYTADSAIVQTCVTGGTAVYNGNWVQFQIQVPANYVQQSSTSYWDLYYQINTTAYAGDTLAVDVQYLGSPVHLLPAP